MFGFIKNKFDGRSVGKQVASSFDIKPNLFFTCLEQVVPVYLDLLSNLYKTGSSIEELKEYTAPLVLQGLDVLEQRFGPQAQITDARVKVQAYLAEA
ncbi:hypothetical protein [Vibrio parahaemolyticus]|uniref:hypothetical protein n=1 Tax=Vibrio parahaemolyticus TaxID=670 RepID=UPI0023605B35|nr:hypothetical protein [Vibrio parahaemolyticus]